jgi:multiple sugar transport system substrate-binding protein
MSEEKVSMTESRRTFLKGAAAAASATSLGGLGLNTLVSTPAHAADYAPGMTGGPTGFDGAERFQYNSTMSEGRAIEGIKALKATGKAPQKLTVLLLDGTIDQIRKPFRDGVMSPLDVWMREADIEIEMIGASPGDMFKKAMEDVTTGSGAFDIYMGPWNSTGDLVAAGGAIDCSEFVKKYKPDWRDPERGVTTEEFYKLLYTYNDKNYMIGLDGDTLCWFYQKKLYEKPEVKEAFLKEVGRPLAVPNTWEEVDAISKFFTGKDFGTGKLYGNGCVMSRFWGLPTFYMRFASMALPNYYFFNEEGHPNLNTDLGVQCAEEHVRSFQWSPPDALNFTFLEGWNSLWNLQVPQICTFSALPKYGDGLKPDGTPKSKATGLIGTHAPVGRKFGDKINRRAVMFYSVTGWISPKSKNNEAAYLFLQWLGSTRIFTLMMASPTGYFDPFQKANFKEPLVAANYQPYQMENIPYSMERSVPTLNFAGQTALDSALDDELQAALTKQKTPRQAMEAAQGKWEQIIRRHRDKGIIDAIKASRSSWPTRVDNA